MIYGAILNIRDGAKVKKGDTIAEWDSYSNPILADLSATVEYQDIEEGVTMSQQVDAVTGFSTKVITESKSTDVKPTVHLVDEAGSIFKSSRAQLSSSLCDSMGGSVTY